MKLAEDEAWARQIIDGFVLMDGAQLGASVLGTFDREFQWLFLDVYDSVCFFGIDKTGTDGSDSI